MVDDNNNEILRIESHKKEVEKYLKITPKRQQELINKMGEYLSNYESDYTYELLAHICEISETKEEVAFITQGIIKFLADDLEI